MSTEASITDRIQSACNAVGKRSAALFDAKLASIRPADHSSPPELQGKDHGFLPGRISWLAERYDDDPRWRARNAGLAELGPCAVEMVEAMLKEARREIDEHPDEASAHNAWPSLLAGYAKFGFDELRQRLVQWIGTVPQRNSSDIDELKDFQEALRKIGRDVASIAVERGKQIESRLTRRAAGSYKELRGDEGGSTLSGPMTVDEMRARFGIKDGVHLSEEAALKHWRELGNDRILVTYSHWPFASWAAVFGVNKSTISREWTRLRDEIERLQQTLPTQGRSVQSQKSDRRRGRTGRSV